jgi:2'-5' RNA ligase
MRQTTRTFIAIPIPDPIGQTIIGLQAELSPEIPSCRWTASLPFHLTLAFLGDVSNRDLDELCAAVAAACEGSDPFELQVAGLGAFPSPRRARVVWAGASAPDENPLYHLHTAVVGAVARVGYRPDDLRFHPHVTLGRIKTDRAGGPDLSGLFERRRDWTGGSFPVSEVVTFASTLERGGVSYTPLGRAPLSH